MDDLISRQALCEYALNQKDKSVTPNDIMRFPSVQPGLDEWCKDCKEYDKERHCCPRWNRVIRETVEEWKSNQPEIIHCGDCRHWKNNHLCECLSRYGTFETEIYFYCGFAEKRDE